jgi:hypothetical protein
MITQSILKSRRFWTGLVAIAALFALGWFKGADVAWPLASIAMGTSAANALQKRGQHEQEAK